MHDVQSPFSGVDVRELEHLDYGQEGTEDEFALDDEDPGCNDHGALARESLGSTRSTQESSHAEPELGEADGLIGDFADHVRKGLASAAVLAAVSAGERDERVLTNRVFFALHPELGGRALRRDETTLAREWQRIRDQLVRRVLRIATHGSPSTSAVRQRMRTQQLRDAWSHYAGREDLMVGADVLGRRPQVNPLLRDAAEALGRALGAAGYRADRVGSYKNRTIKGTNRKSLHAYGVAIDIDPKHNPHRRGKPGPARWATGATQEARRAEVAANRADTSFTASQIAAARTVRTIDGFPVFYWSGGWNRSPDAMHFQVDVTPDELSRGLVLGAQDPAPDLNESEVATLEGVLVWGGADDREDESTGSDGDDDEAYPNEAGGPASGARSGGTAGEAVAGAVDSAFGAENIDKDFGGGPAGSEFGPETDVTATKAGTPIWAHLLEGRTLADELNGEAHHDDGFDGYGHQPASRRAGWAPPDEEQQESPVVLAPSHSFSPQALAELPDIIQASPLIRLEATIPTARILWMITGALGNRGAEPGWADRLLVDVTDLPKVAASATVHVSVFKAVPFDVTQQDKLQAFLRYCRRQSGIKYSSLDAMSVGPYLLNRTLEDLLELPAGSVSAHAGLASQMTEEEAAHYKLVVYAVLPAAVGRLVSPRDHRSLRSFDFAKWSLTAEHERLLSSLAREVVRSWLSRRIVSRITIEGHTDPVGKRSDNIKLGERRAESVARRLKELITDHGTAMRFPDGVLDRIRYVVTSHGEDQPLSRTKQALNRRVEITVHREHTPPPQPLDKESTIRRQHDLVVGASQLDPAAASRLLCLLEKVIEEGTDDRYANDTQVFLINRDNDTPAPTEWNRALSSLLDPRLFGPTTSDARVVANLARLDEDITSGIIKMNQIVEYASGASWGLGLLALSTSFKQFNSWVNERLRNASSLYSCYAKDFL